MERARLCRPKATSASGPTASTCRRIGRTRRNASWSSSAPRRRARRSCSALSTARARALTTDAPCCSISSAGVCRWRPRSPSPMARSASGKQSASSGPRPVSNDAGCIRPPMSKIRVLNCLSKGDEVAQYLQLSYESGLVVRKVVSAVSGLSSISLPERLSFAFLIFSAGVPHPLPSLSSFPSQRLGNGLKQNAPGAPKIENPKSVKDKRIPFATAHFRGGSELRSRHS